MTGRLDAQVVANHLWFLAFAIALGFAFSPVLTAGMALFGLVISLAASD